MRRRRLLVATLAATALLLAACDRAAELIPGQATAEPSATPTPTATETGPILVTPALDLGGSATPAAGARSDGDLARSVVQVRVVDRRGGAPGVVRDGTGVVIDAQRRLVLTSYVLVDPVAPDGGDAYTSITIATAVPGEEPEERFEAEIVAADPAAEIAVLRVVRTASGQALRGTEFTLAAVEIHEEATIVPGDQARLFGFPGTEADSAAAALTVTNATVTGFRGEAGRTGNAWLKTDARLPYGAQGGPAFDADGRLVGILVQPVFQRGAPVALVRPVSLALDQVANARAAAPTASFAPPLTVRGGLLNASNIGGGGWVSRPEFAESAIERPQGFDLFDYGQVFPTGMRTLYYEFVAQGIANETLIEERWYHDGVYQDQLSLTYPWTEGTFGFIADQVATPNPAGFPDGAWLLEIWVDGRIATSATALLGAEPAPPSVQAQDPAFGGTASSDRRATQSAFIGGPRLMLFFAYSNMEHARSYRWLVFRNGQLVHTSPDVAWPGGNDGRWWVGYRAPASIAAGRWEFELQVDGRVLLTDATTLP